MQMKCYAARLVSAPSFELRNHCFMNIQCWCWTNWYVHRHWRHVRRCWSQEERVHSELCSSDAEMSSLYGAKGGMQTALLLHSVLKWSSSRRLVIQFVINVYQLFLVWGKGHCFCCFFLYCSIKVYWTIRVTPCESCNLTQTTIVSSIN